MKDEYKTTDSPYHQCSKEDIGACDKCHEAVSKPKEAGGKHDMVGAGIFSFCKKCKRHLISLGIPQEKCKPTTNN